VLLALVAIGYPLGAAALLQALGRDPKLAVFACLPFFGRALAIGFVPFCASMPVVFVALALFVRQCRAPTRRRAVGLGILGVVLFYLHVDAYLVAALASAAMSLVLRLPGLRERKVSVVWAVMRDLAFWIPSALLVVRWYLAGSLQTRGGSAGTDVGRMEVWRAVKALPLWIHDPWPARFDDGAGLLWWLGVLALVATNFDALRRERPGQIMLLYAPLGVGVLLVLALPFHVGAAGMLNVRLATFVALAVLLPLPPVRGWGGRTAITLAVTATLVLSVGSAVHMRSASHAELGDFSSLLETMRPGERVESLHFQARSDAAYAPPWMHVEAYHTAERRGISEWTFGHLPHWSVHLRASAAGPTHPLFWNVGGACLFRNAEDGAWSNWVLVEGDIDPFANDPPGPRYELARRSGRFSLYGRTSGTWPGDPARDPGPCP
jgi:hypothetical protein